MAGLDLFAFAERSQHQVAAPLPQNPCRLPADPPPEALQIREVLATHVGRSAAITAPAIAAAAGLWPDRRPEDRGTMVRELVAAWYPAMLQTGLVLVAASEGYWLTSDPADVSNQCQSLRSRQREIGHRERNIRMAAKCAGMIYHGHGHWAREVTP